MKRIIGLILVNLFCIVVLKFTTEHFFSKDNLIVLIDNMALETIALSGYTLLIIGGYFDLSIDGVVSLCGVIAGLLMVQHVPWIIAVLIALALGGIIGAFNGWVVAKLNINGFIATLTTWWICVGTSLGLTKALSPFGFPKAFQMLGQSKFLGFRSLVFYAIAFMIILSIILHFHRIGAHIYASGDNKIASEMMGIQVTRLGIGLYTLVGLIGGFIGIMTASRLNASSPVAVDGMALKVIAAFVIGGGRLNGGIGSIIGGLLGLVLMNILSNASIQLGISPYWQKAMLGGILLSAVLLERINLRFGGNNDV